jgi:hypothetical protein
MKKIFIEGKYQFDDDSSEKLLDKVLIEKQNCFFPKDYKNYSNEEITIIFKKLIKKMDDVRNVPLVDYFCLESVILIERFHYLLLDLNIINVLSSILGDKYTIIVRKIF